MKNLIKLLSLAIIFIVGLASCADPCDKKDCGNGNCEGDGNCICDDYYGKDADGACNVALSTALAGMYAAQTTCERDGRSSDTLQVDAGSNPNEVIIRNFQGAANNDITLTLNPSNDITIDQTDYTGSGILSGSVFSFKLYSTGDTCSVSLIKQL